VLVAGYVSAASLGKLVPHLDWMTRFYGVSLGLAGFALSCVMLPGALAGWSFGALSDRYGAKHVAIAGLLIAAVASVASGYANSFAVLVIVRIVEGVGYSFLVVAGTVLAVESLPARSALALSVWSSFAPVGFALGQWAGAFAAGDAPLRVIGAVHALILIAAALALHVIAPAPRRQREPRSGWSAMRHLPAQRTALAFGATCMVIIAAVAVTPVALASRGGLAVAQVASLTALAALPALAGRIAPGWLLERGTKPLTIFVLAACVAGLSIAGVLAAPLWPALALFVLFQIAAGMLPGLLSAMMAQVAPAEQLGAFSGICTQTINVGNLLGPPLVLAAYATAGTGAALTLLVALLAASILLIAGLGVYRRSLHEAVV
jgi:MFS family permease